MIILTIINENTIVVSTYNELKNAIESENEYNYIYFDNDITLDAGIKIPSSKITLTIDGTYNNIRHTYTDNRSLNTTNIIAVTSATTTYVKVANLNIVGQNYYGVIYVPEQSTYVNTIIEYNNITYTGPQISFNPNGLTRFIDANITVGDTALTTGNEIAECNKIEVGGNTTIIHNSASNSAFWFRNANPSFKVLANANVTFTSPNRELFYGPTDLELTILNNAQFTITTKNGLAYAQYGTKNTTIYPNASLTISKTAYSGSYATWYSYRPITLEEQSSLIIINNYPSITTSNYNISFPNTSGALILHNPKKFLLYNEKANIINTAGTIKFQFQFSRLNLFTTAIPINDNISLATLPTYAWYKNDISLVEGTFTSQATAITTTNYTTEELETLPALSNLIFANKKIMSIGIFPFTIHPISDTATQITGTTIPNSSLLITYDTTSVIVEADSTGTYTHTLAEALPIGTSITFQVKKYHDLLYLTKQVQIIYSGELFIETIPDLITFTIEPIQKDPLLCPKKEPLTIKITDTRVDPTNWKLYATIPHDLETKTANILPNSLVFKDTNDTITSLSQTPTLIYEKNTDFGDTTITFPEDQGILLNITQSIINQKEYETKIIWTIET